MLATRRGLVPKETALQRACRAWRGEAALIRGGLRRRGVHGELRTLDEIASGERGRAAPKGLATLAWEMAANGIPLAEREARLMGLAQMIARLPDGPDAA